METHGYFHDVNNYLVPPQQQQTQQQQQHQQSIQQSHNDAYLNPPQFYQSNQAQYNLQQQQQQQQQNPVLQLQQQQQQYFGGQANTVKLADDTALRHKTTGTIDGSNGSTTSSVSFNSSNLNVEINCNQYPNNLNTSNNNSNSNNIGYPINLNNSNSNNSSTNMLTPPYFYHYPHQKVQNSCDIPNTNNSSNSSSTHQNNSNSTAATYYDATYQKNISHSQQYPSVYPPSHHYYHHPNQNIGHAYSDIYNQNGGRHAGAGHHSSAAANHRNAYYAQQAQYSQMKSSMPQVNSTAVNYNHYATGQTVRNSNSHTENVYGDLRYNQYYQNTTGRQYPANYYPPQMIPASLNQSSRSVTNLPSSQELSRSRNVQRAMYSNNPLHQTSQHSVSGHHQFVASRNGLYPATGPTNNNSVIKSTAAEMLHEANQHHGFDDRYSHAPSMVNGEGGRVKYFNNCLYNGERGTYVQPGTVSQSASCELNNLYQNYHQMRRSDILPSYNATTNNYMASHSDMYSLNSAKISSSQSNSAMHRNHHTSPSDKFNFIDLEDQINCSKIMKSRDNFYIPGYHPVDVTDENLKSQNLRDFLATWNEEEDDEAKHAAAAAGYSTTHIEIGNSGGNKFENQGKRDCEEDGNNNNSNNNNNNNSNTAPRIHVGITVGNSNNSNNLPDIIIDIEKTKTHSGDDGSLSIVNNSEKLYVLESIDVPVADLSKYKHLSVVNKLPENIIHISRANGEFGETIETSLKFIEEVEKNREKYYKNDFELNVEYESGKNSPTGDRKGAVPLVQFDDDFMYDYEVNKFLKDSLDMIEAEEKNKNRILPKFEKYTKEEVDCIVIEDDEDEVKIKIEPKEEKMDSYIPAKRRKVEKMEVENLEVENVDGEKVMKDLVHDVPEPPKFQPKQLKNLCNDYLNTTEYKDFCTPKFNPKTLRDICEQYMDETEITIMIPEPLMLREICENYIMSHREYFIVHEAYCEDESCVPTLKSLCEQVLDTNYYFEFDTSGDEDMDEPPNDTNNNSVEMNPGTTTNMENFEFDDNNEPEHGDTNSNDTNNNIQINDEGVHTFPATMLVAANQHDDDINEIIINDHGTNRKLIHDKLYLKYSKKFLYYQSNFKNMKKILKKYFIYFVRRRKISIEKFLSYENRNKNQSSLLLNDTTTFSSYSGNSNSNTNNIIEDDTSNDNNEMIFLSNNDNHESQLLNIAKDDKKIVSIPNNSNNNNNSNSSSNDSSKPNSNIPKPHKKRKMNFDEILLNIDKYYSNSHNLNNNISSSHNNNNSGSHNHNNSHHHHNHHHHHHHHHTKNKRDTSSSHHSSNNRKVSRLIIPRSKILNVDELKTIRENNVKLPYVRLERNIYIDKLARMQS